MGKLCKLTGVEIPEGGFEKPLISKMCLNCSFCTDNGDETYNCTNENVIEAGKKKILASIPEGFEVETLVLKPMSLKNPTKKCNNYKADIELVHTLVDNMLS